MMTPHESLNLNQARGLLAAVNGNPSYRARAGLDLRRPPGLPAPDARLDLAGGSLRPRERVLARRQARSTPRAPRCPRSPRSTSPDPKHPHAIWQGNLYSHGMTLSDNGDRAYVADPSSGDMLILDTSQIQERKPNPQVREISRLTWKSASIPQNAIPVHRERPSLRARVRRVHRRHAQPAGQSGRGRRGADHRHQQ